MGKIIKAVFLAPVKFYQKIISPAIGKNCIYTPSCSHYMVEAVEKHGVIKGGILGVARILRCSRFFLGGEDPVPEEFSFKNIRTPYIVFKRRRSGQR